MAAIQTFYALTPNAVRAPARSWPVVRKQLDAFTVERDVHRLLASGLHNADGDLLIRAGRQADHRYLLAQHDHERRRVAQRHADGLLRHGGRGEDQFFAANGHSQLDCFADDPSSHSYPFHSNPLGVGVLQVLAGEHKGHGWLFTQFLHVIRRFRLYVR